MSNQTVGACMTPYILEQETLFWDVFEKKEELTADFVSLFREVSPKEIALIASGTSYHGAATAAAFMQMVLGMKVTALSPSSALRQQFSADTLAVMVTQGGNSTNTVASIKRIQETCPTFVITGELSSMAAQISRHVMLLPCGEELAGPKTKGYLITVLTLYLCALETARALGLQSKERLAELEKYLTDAGKQMGKNIAAGRKWAEDNVVLLAKPQSYYFISLGLGLKIAAEGALKMMETFLMPTSTYEFEEFLHGPACTLGQAVGGIYLLPEESDVDYERMQRLVKYHRMLCPSVFTVGLTSVSDSRDCELVMTGQWYTRPFELIFPLQWASAVVPERMGVDGAGTGRFADLDAIMQIKFAQESAGNAGKDQ